MTAPTYPQTQGEAMSMKKDTTISTACLKCGCSLPLHYEFCTELETNLALQDKEEKEKKIASGSVVVFPDGGRGFFADGKSPSSYMTLTDETAWLDENNVVHLGSPPQS